MITQSNLIRRSGYFSRIMALPLLLVLASAFAVKITSKSPAKRSAAYAIKTLTVVIDPGHGGIFPGTQNENGLLEKNITLSLAQKIQALAKSYNVHIVLTRNSDALVGNASNLKEDLQNRVALANNAKPDLFVSIHVNSTGEKTTSLSGFDAYISGRNAHTGDRELASVLLTGLKDVYAVNETIQQREIGIVVLDKSTCPAVCLECGYITNPQDVSFITNPINQEKVARKILEGIVQYSLVGIDQKETTQTENKVLTDTAVLTGLEAKEQLLAMAKEQLDKSTVEKTFSAIETKDTIPAGKGVIFTKVENEADYPGGQPGWTKYLISHLKYPEAAVKKNIQGTVVVRFIVDQEGKVSDVKAISGPKELQDASIKVIKESGNWISAMQNGKKVKAYKKQPITYKLSAS